MDETVRRHPRRGRHLPRLPGLHEKAPLAAVSGKGGFSVPTGAGTPYQGILSGSFFTGNSGDSLCNSIEINLLSLEFPQFLLFVPPADHHQLADCPFGV